MESRRGGGAGWWRRSIVNLVGGEEGRWFWGSLRKELGNGGSTEFWNGKWLGDCSLKSRFSRLYGAAVYKNGLVSDMGQWRDGVWSWEFRWRRILFDREKAMEEELGAEVRNCRLKNGVPDSWKWGDEGSKDFSVKTAYNLIMKNRSDMVRNLTFNNNGRRIWKTIAPFKVQVMA